MPPARPVASLSLLPPTPASRCLHLLSQESLTLTTSFITTLCTCHSPIPKPLSHVGPTRHPLRCCLSSSLAGASCCCPRNQPTLLFDKDVETQEARRQAGTANATARARSPQHRARAVPPAIPRVSPWVGHEQRAPTRLSSGEARVGRGAPADPARPRSGAGPDSLGRQRIDGTGDEHEPGQEQLVLGPGHGDRCGVPSGQQLRSGSPGESGFGVGGGWVSPCKRFRSGRHMTRLVPPRVGRPVPRERLWWRGVCAAAGGSWGAQAGRVAPGRAAGARRRGDPRRAAGGRRLLSAGLPRNSGGVPRDPSLIL